MASEIPEMVYAFGPQPNAIMAVGILIKYFRLSCSSLSEDSAEFRYVPLYIADHPSILQVEFRCSFYKNFTPFQSKFHIGRRLTAFPQQKKKLVGYAWI